VRITSGWAKGLALAAPAGEATRPTSAKVRAAALNMLQAELPEALVLELFAGSGALGIEAVSRGARGAVWVEQAAPALKALRANVAELEKRAKANGEDVRPLSVLSGDALAAWSAVDASVRSLLDPARPSGYGAFSVVFSDPPYGIAADAAKALAAPLAVRSAPGAVWLHESDTQGGATILAAGDPEGWELVKQRAHGDTMITIFERRTP